MAVGVKNISGQWKSGEAVSIINNTGKHIARYLCAISSTDPLLYWAFLLKITLKDYLKKSSTEMTLVLLSPSKN